MTHCLEFLKTLFKKIILPLRSSGVLYNKYAFISSTNEPVFDIINQLSQNSQIGVTNGPLNYFNALYDAKCIVECFKIVVTNFKKVLQLYIELAHYVICYGYFYHLKITCIDKS